MGSEVTPLFFQNMVKLYDELESNSEVMDFDGVSCKVFMGRVVEVYDGLGLSRAHYTPLFSTLVEQGCITKLQQGSRGATSVIVLHERPAERDFAGVFGKPLTDRPQADTLSRRVERIEKRLGGLDIVEAFANLEKRLKRLEKGERSGKTKRSAS